MLLAFRIVASIGIGGEWAAGASMVAEVVPEKRRVEAGALLYTAAPAGLFLATFVNHRVAGVWLAGSPTVSWRYVFLFGLVPAAAAFIVRLFVREPERWQAVKQAAAPWRELFGPQFRRRTLWGTFVAIIGAGDLVELQCLHPDAGHRAGARVGGGAAPGRTGYPGPGRGTGSAPRPTCSTSAA